MNEMLLICDRSFDCCFVDGVFWRRHQSSDHWLKDTDWQDFFFGIERRIVVEVNELSCVFEVRLASKHLTHIAIHANMVKEIVTLKNAMVLDHP